MKNKKSRKQIARFGSAIGRCAIKSVGSELFLPLLKLKGKASEAEEAYEKLASSVLAEFNIKKGDMASAETNAKIQQQLGILLDEEVDFEPSQILSLEKFIALSDENPGLTASELEVLQDFLVIENGKNHQPTN